MKIERPSPYKRLKKKANKGSKRYPMATVAFYGPTDRLASKVAVGIMPEHDSEPLAMERWIVEDGDIRACEGIMGEVLAFIAGWQAQSVVMVDGIFGCPHEAGVDYEGETCPHCPFWADRDRFTGARIR